MDYCLQIHRKFDNEFEFVKNPGQFIITVDFYSITKEILFEIIIKYLREVHKSSK